METGAHQNTIGGTSAAARNVISGNTGNGVYITDAKAADSIKNGVKENGKTTMKAFGDKLNDADIKALVAYVRTLKK